MGTLAYCRSEGLAAAEVASRVPSLAAADAALLVAIPADNAVTLGAFQRRSEVVGEEGALLRRESGGAAARVGPGSVWVRLALSRVDALVRCTPDKLLNRYVRPLLRALTKTGAHAHYFGRDWISAAHRPVALVAFAHDGASGRALFEAIVAVQTPFALGARPSFLGKSSATLEEIAGGAVEPSRVADAILEAYRGIAASSLPRGDAPTGIVGADVGADPPWAAVREEAIGHIAAGRDASGRLRIGGELMASSDAVAALEDALAALPDLGDRAAVGAAVDAALTAPSAVVFGIRSLASVRDVIVEAGGPRGPRIG